MKEINTSLDRYCTGTDKELARLREKYKENAEVAITLEKFETSIEAPANKK